MPQIERFAVGSIECQIVPDGVAMYEPADLAAGVPADQIIAAVTAGVDENGQMAVPYNCLLIRSGGRIALVDAGLGAEGARHFGEPAGHLMDSLAAGGITADQVDPVIISHAHLDHIGGLTAAADGGRIPVFTRARHYFWRAEWDFWTSGEGLAQVPGELADAARTHLPPLQQAGLVELVSEETEVLPGVQHAATPSGPMAITASATWALRCQHPDNSLGNISIQTAQRSRSPPPGTSSVFPCAAEPSTRPPNRNHRGIAGLGFPRNGVGFPCSQAGSNGQ